MLQNHLIFFGGSFILLLNLFLLSGGDRAQAGERTKIGLVEDVILLTWGIRLPARIDTGAAHSSLDARELTIKDNVAEFKLPAKYGGRQLRLPIIKWQTIRSAESKERRPVVEIELCVGPKHLRSRVNLNDRSKVKYPLIIGRDILRENFVVDCMESKCAPPSCPEVFPK
jgi:hypothetical protein